MAFSRDVLRAVAGGLLMASVEVVMPHVTEAADLSIGDARVTEGNQGTTTARLQVRLTGGSSIGVMYATSAGTATSGTDFTARRGTLVFRPGETTKEILVPVRGNRFDEPDKTFFVTLSNPHGARLVRNRGTVTIVDDDPEPTVAFATASQTVTEGQTATVNLQLSSPSRMTISVPLEVTGTATTGTDFQLSANPVVIQRGESRGTTTVRAISDISTGGASEGSETVVLTLGNPTYADFGRTVEHTVTITNVGEFSNFRAVPAGCFQMGGTTNSNEGPVHEVCVGGIRSAKYFMNYAATASGMVFSGRSEGAVRPWV